MKSSVDKLIESLLPAGRSAAEEFRIQIQRLLNSYSDLSQFSQIVYDVSDRAYRLEPLIAETMRNAQLLTWLRAGQQAAKPLALQPTKPPPREPIFDRADDDREPSPIVSLPKIEAAANYLHTRLDFTQDEFEQLDDEAKQVGFTVARLASTEAVRAVRDALFDDITEGGTLRDFRRNVAEAIADSSLADHHVEAIYRTHLGRAYSAGQRRVLSTQLVSDEFPYLMYVATHDSRVRPDHLALEKMGLNGTAVYRSDDPFWDKFTPPWGWNCRCSTIPLSIEDAAEYGVREAIAWRDSGLPPTIPEWVTMPLFELPKGWIPVSARITPAFAAA
jgi:SPP1 gp7 family putative phage head morphogenesis protein